MSSLFDGGISVSIFGESHGRGIGVVLDNLPSGEEIDLEQLGDSACAYLRAVAMQTVETVAQVEGVDTSELLEHVSKEADAYRASRATSPDVVKDA